MSVFIVSVIGLVFLAMFVIVIAGIIHTFKIQADMERQDALEAKERKRLYEQYQVKKKEQEEVKVLPQLTKVPRPYEAKPAIVQQPRVSRPAKPAISDAPRRSTSSSSSYSNTTYDYTDYSSSSSSSCSSSSSSSGGSSSSSDSGGGGGSCD